jgi:hypothetical protein
VIEVRHMRGAGRLGAKRFQAVVERRSGRERCHRRASGVVRVSDLKEGIPALYCPDQGAI